MTDRALDFGLHTNVSAKASVYGNSNSLKVPDKHITVKSQARTHTSLLFLDLRQGSCGNQTVVLSAYAETLGRAAACAYTSVRWPFKTSAEASYGFPKQVVFP